MVIAVNTRSLIPGFRDGYSEFIFDCFTTLAKKYPQHQFIYIFDRPFDKQCLTSKNMTGVVAGPQAKQPLLLQYWYNYKLPAVLRKHKADVLVNVDGFCSLCTKVPQCLIVQNFAFLHHPEFFTASHLRFYKKFTPAFLQKVKSIVTFSEFSKKDITGTYKIAEEKIAVVQYGPGEIFTPIHGKEKEIIKERYTEGREYFLYAGTTDTRNNLLHLLKAFSFFKKRQQSNMQLLIAATPDNSFTESLKTYKYRTAVKIVGLLPIEEQAKITAAAYAVVYLSVFENIAMSTLEAMQCEVPVITNKAGVLPEICGDAVLYANPTSFEDIADKMMLLFKDENKRNELIEKGKAQVLLFSREKAVNAIWQSVLKATE